MRRVVGTIVLILLMWCFGLALIVQAEHSRQDDWTEYIELICLDSKICPELVEAIIEKESSWDPAAALMFYNAGYSDKLGIRAYENGVISSYASEILERAAELEKLHGK